MNWRIADGNTLSTLAANIGELTGVCSSDLDIRNHIMARMLLIKISWSVITFHDAGKDWGASRCEEARAWGSSTPASCSRKDFVKRDFVRAL